MTEPIGAATYQIRRFAESAVVNFKNVSAVESTFDIRASIQPLGREVYNMPAGLKSRVQFKMYTTAELFVVRKGSKRASDRIFYDGEWFELEKAEVHNNFAPIPHSKFYLVGPEV